MTEPTDAELWQLYMQQPGQHKDPIDFARAALAKWGSLVVAGEPAPTPAAQAAESVTAPAGGVVAYLDIGAGGYLDLGSDLSNEAISRLPKGRHALIVAGTFGIDGYTPTPPAQAADSVLEDAARWRELREQHESDEVLCCVFAPNDMRECLFPVGSLPGELDAFMDAERAARKQGGVNG